MPAANHSMLNMAARYGNAPAVRALLKAGAEPSHADATGWHMPLHHLTHCKGCSEEVALRIAQMLVAAGAEPGLARDKNGVAAAVTSSHRFAWPLAPQRLPSAAGYASARPKFHPASANQPWAALWPAIYAYRAHELSTRRSLRPKRRLGVGGSPS